MQATSTIDMEKLIAQASNDCRSGVADSPSLRFLRDWVVQRGIQLSEHQCLLLSCCSDRPTNNNPFNTPAIVYAELGISLATTLRKFVPGDRRSLSQVAESLEYRLQFQRRKAQEWKAGGQARLRRPAQARTTYERELQAELAAAAASVKEAKEELQRAREQKAEHSWLHPLDRWNAGKGVKEAKAVVLESERQYQTIYEDAVSPANEARRNALVAAQNKKADVDAANREFWSQIVSGCGKLEVALNAFMAKAGPAIVSAKSSDWFQWPEGFVQMAEAFLVCNFQQAEAILNRLDFRHIPSEDFYRDSTASAQALLRDARSLTRGHAAVFGYPGVIDPTVQLACPGLVSPIPRKLMAGTNTARRWRRFETRLCCARSFELEPLWVYFWVMFFAGQSLANDMGRRGSEDSLTFKLCAYIAHAAQWGEKLLPQFGYPTGGGNFIGTLGIAGEKPEHVTGADLGILVDIALGDVRVRKLALFQAKNSVNGRANVASRTDQLGKLSRLPNHGYYLFYHRQGDEVPVPSATVRRACDLHAELTASGPLPVDKTSLRVNTCVDAWELASLVAFGLAQPGSGHGVVFNDIDHALALMSDRASALGLPRYLQIVTLGQPDGQLLSRLMEYGYYKPLVFERVPERTPERGRGRKEPKTPSQGYEMS